MQQVLLMLRLLQSCWWGRLEVPWMLLLCLLLWLPLLLRGVLAAAAILLETRQQLGLP
jgi:hypothetical protein